ncbi:MAG: iron-containing alcohol dehydrogenase [Rhodobacterales bacterium]
MNPFTFNTTKSIVFRPGAAAEMGETTRAVLGDKVLFVTDAGIVALGLCAPAIASLEAKGAHVSVFDTVEADPSRATLEAAVAMGQAISATGVIGFGGGSAMDVAKVAALLLGSGEDLDAAWGVGNAKGPRLPLVLVPTTAGTGSEVTPVSIISVGGEEKRGVSSAILLPDIAVLDAELTLGLPGPITAATGVDAMVHAIESYASANANNNPISQLLARQALRLLGANILKVMETPRDIEARSAMLLGATLAGQAFGNSPVAAVHALAYPIGGTFHVPHGVSNALILPHVLRFNAPAANNAYSEIAADAFPHLESVPHGKERCAGFIAEIDALIAKVRIPARLRDVDIPQSAIDKMAADAMLQTRLLVNNPREVTQEDARIIYHAAW